MTGAMFGPLEIYRECDRGCGTEALVYTEGDEPVPTDPPVRRRVRITEGRTVPRLRRKAAMSIHFPKYRQPFWLDGLYQDGDGYYRFDDDRKIDAEAFAEAWSALGRNHAPALLFDMILGHHLDSRSTPAWSPTPGRRPSTPSGLAILGACPRISGCSCSPRAGTPTTASRPPSH